MSEQPRQDRSEPDDGSDSPDTRIAHAEFTISDQDRRKLVRLSVRQQPAYWTAVGSSVVAVAAGIGVVAAATSKTFGVVLIAGGLGMLLWIAQKPNRVADKAARNPGSSEARRFTFTEDGVEQTTESSKGSLAWSRFDKFSEWDGWLGLRLSGTNQYLFIRQSGFVSEADEATFRELAAQHVGQ